MLDKRKKKILTAVIEDYVLTAEPVGSKRLVGLYRLDVSPATVRHELAALEEMGYLVQPHPSAGRIPSDKGYRFYVDSLAGAKPLANSEQESISNYYSMFNNEMEELMRDTSSLLSRMTSYASLVFAPVLMLDRLKHLDLVLLSPRQVLLVAITGAGSVAKKIFELGKECDAPSLYLFETLLNEHLVGLTATQMRKVDLSAVSATADKKLLGDFRDALIELLIKRDSERVYHDGTANLLSQPEFESLNRVQKLLSTLERSYQLLELLSEVSREYRLVVKIGAENGALDIEGCSLVATSYRVEGESLGALGILGPTRMDYPRAISAVQYIADNLSNLLESVHKRS